MDKNELHDETTKELALPTSMWGLECETKSKGWQGALDELPWNLNTQCMGNLDDEQANKWIAGNSNR
jgi:hypothetical protein